MEKVILYLENDTQYRETLAKLLRRRGYDVIEAATVDDAHRLLSERYVHLLLVDIRMEDDNKADDRSGLIFAQTPAYRLLPKIILTAYPNYEQVREVMTRTGSQPPAAVQFLTKDDGAKAIIDAVSEAFQHEVGSNWDLTVAFAPSAAEEYLVALLGERQRGSFGGQMRVELDSLLRKIFKRYAQVTISRMLVHRDGCIWLEVEAYQQQGHADQSILLIGLEEQVRREHNRYEEFAPQGRADGAYHADRLMCGWRLAAKQYVPVGASPDALVTLETAAHDPQLAKVGAAVDHLYAHVLNYWHEQARTRCTGKELLDACCKRLELLPTLPSEAIAGQIEAVLAESSRNRFGLGEMEGDEIVLHDENGARHRLPIPIIEPAHLSSPPSTWSALIHGTVLLETILMDTNDKTWLLDHRCAAVGPLLFDYISLEFDLVRTLPSAAPLTHRYALIQHIYTSPTLDCDVVSSQTESSLSGTLKTVERIRKLAANEIGKEIDGYYWCLWLYYLKSLLEFDSRLHHTSRQIAPVFHSLLGFCLIGQRLVLQPAAGAFLLDEANRMLHVAERPVSLTPQEYQIVEFLYQHKNEVCSRRAIIECALHEEYVRSRGDKDRLNSAIKRLREKIEDDPTRPVFIETVRGHGYRLSIPA